MNISIEFDRRLLLCAALACTLHGCQTHEAESRSTNCRCKRAWCASTARPSTPRTAVPTRRMSSVLEAPAASDRGAVREELGPGEQRLGAVSRCTSPTARRSRASWRKSSPRCSSASWRKAATRSSTEPAADVVEMQAAIVNLYITAPDVSMQTAGRTKVYTSDAGRDDADHAAARFGHRDNCSRAPTTDSDGHGPDMWTLDDLRHQHRRSETNHLDVGHRTAQGAATPRAPTALNPTES